MMISHQNYYKALTIAGTGSVVVHCVLPSLYTSVSQAGSIPSPGAVCAIGFQSKLASAGFPQELRLFPPAERKISGPQWK